jgi:hypothetical protein
LYGREMRRKRFAPSFGVRIKKKKSILHCNYLQSIVLMIMINQCPISIIPFVLRPSSQRHSKSVFYWFLCWIQISKYDTSKKIADIHLGPVLPKKYVESRYK